MSLRRFLTAMSMLAITAVLIASFAQPAFAQADEEDEQGPNMMSRIFGSLGLLSLPGPSIDTSERPPLVVPPMTNYVQPTIAPNADLMPQGQQQNPWDFSAPRQEHLPPPSAIDNRPQQSVSLPLPQEQNTVRQRNPDFPLDPEVRAAQKRKKKKGTTVSGDPDAQWNRLRPDQLQTAGPKSRPDRPGTDSLGEQTLTRARPDQLNVPNTGFFSMFRTKKEEPVAFQGEPERQTLTQPPAGYLTPSANAPYGIVSPEAAERPRASGHQNSPNNTDGAVAR